MRLLLDESVPRNLRRFLPDHTVRTVIEMRWGGITNGEVLRLAASEFDAFITVDKNLRYQQNLARRQIGIVVLLSTDWHEVRRRTREIDQAIAAVRPGGVIEVPIREH